MKTKRNISAYIIRSVMYAVFLSVAFIAASSAFDSPNKWYKSAVATVGYGSTAKSPSQPRALSFAERVAYQRAIEDVYWRYRIWPKQNPDPKPSLDAVMSQAQLEKRITDYLQKSQELEAYWQQPITAEQLQAEMDRMAQHTRQPQVLRELFAALGNDPFVIAECLARPLLAERLLTQSAREQVKQTSATYGRVIAASGDYNLPSISDDGACTDDTWTATTTANAPVGRDRHTAVWTGSEMIVWGGSFPMSNPGGRYNPSTDSWTATSTTNAPSGRVLHTAVWTGREMIVWGGYNGSYLNTGGRYNPTTNSWTVTSTTYAPLARNFHTAVWTGSEMIVWGGFGHSDPRYLYTGGRYNPNTDTWRGTSKTNAPDGRTDHRAVWTGSEMIVWGGYSAYVSGHYLNTGGRYNPSTDRWIATSTVHAPTGRDEHTAVWTGSKMIVWGGFDGRSPLNTGGRYNLGTNRWTAISTTNAPSGRDHHTAVWTGGEMIVWGGYNGSYLNTGGRYNPTTNSWIATSITNTPRARTQHTAVWTGSEMIVWGGWAFVGGPTNTGGRYCAPRSQLGNISTRGFVQTGDNVVIGGFIIQGTQAKKAIIRAIGPELTQHGVPTALANPTLELHDATGALIASNNDWATTIIGGIITANQFEDIRSSGYAPSDELESAIIADLPPDNYTAIVRGVNNMTGVALMEVYDLSPESNSTLGNISTRAFVQTGDDVMIGGFILAGNEPKTVIVRAIGPELTQYGIPDVLADPTLELHNRTGALIASNDNWLQTIIGGIITRDQVRDIRATGYAPRSPRESAIIATLRPGNYTAIVRGINNTTGVALVEVYDLDQ